MNRKKDHDSNEEKNKQNKNIHHFYNTNKSYTIINNTVSDFSIKYSYTHYSDKC